MPRITGIQRREPYSHSSASYSDYDLAVSSDEFSIKRYKDDRIRIFFKRESAHGQGVGLSLPSTDVANAFGRALLMVAEGCSNEVTISM